MPLCGPADEGDRGVALFKILDPDAGTVAYKVISTNLTGHIVGSPGAHCLAYEGRPPETDWGLRSHPRVAPRRSSGAKGSGTATKANPACPTARLEAPARGSRSFFLTIPLTRPLCVYERGNAIGPGTACVSRFYRWAVQGSNLRPPACKDYDCTLRSPRKPHGCDVCTLDEAELDHP